MLTRALLQSFHIFYGVLLSLISIFHDFRPKPPQPPTNRRIRVPAHLALLLVSNMDFEVEKTERVLLECAERAVVWCQEAGIRRLTVYDREG
jgi:dehydrodolichyl diphosphate syntase complex subunit NUS1